METKITIADLLKKKKDGEKIVTLTAYDYPLAKICDEAGIDIILVGDSLANVVLGLESTTEVGMDQMIHHAKAVSRGVKRALIVGDMPYSGYQKHSERALANARRFFEDAGCDAVKVEWFDKCIEVTEKIIKGGVPVMGHVGLTPQTADQLGGLKVQGKDVASAKRIVENAIAFERAGCFAVVLECIPQAVAKEITARLKIPTIGIGAGVHCDGQVLVSYDMLGLFDRYQPKFVKQYVNLKSIITQAVQSYSSEVRLGQYPDDKHSFHQ